MREAVASMCLMSHSTLSTNFLQAVVFEHEDVLFVFSWIEETCQTAKNCVLIVSLSLSLSFTRLWIDNSVEESPLVITLNTCNMYTVTSSRMSSCVHVTLMCVWISDVLFMSKSSKLPSSCHNRCHSWPDGQRLQDMSSNSFFSCPSIHLTFIWSVIEV